MKSQFVLICILSSIAFVYPKAAKALELKTFRQIEIEKNTCETIEDILSIPFDQQTFENTLKPWTQLIADLNSHLRQFDPILESSPANQLMSDFSELFKEMYQNSHLYTALIQCSQKITDDPSSSPFERYIASSILKKNSNRFIHIFGSCEERNDLEAEFAVLHIKSLNFQKDRFDIAKKLSSSNADVVFIQEISVNDAHDVYDALREEFAHFIYIDEGINPLDFAPSYSSGMFIASNCRIEKARFNPFAKNTQGSNEGFFDFVIKNGERPLGHIYATNLKEDISEGLEVQKFVDLIQKMQQDLFEMEEGSIPFFLSGDFKVLQTSKEGTELLTRYFQYKNNQDALLLESIPSFPNEFYSSNYLIAANSDKAIGDHVASLALLKKKDPRSTQDLLKNNRRSYRSENHTLLCGGQVDVSGRRDSDGNTSAEAKVSTSTERESGTFSTEIRGSVSQDRDGKTSAEVEASASWKW